jgi:hypothetical protein
VTGNLVTNANSNSNWGTLSSTISSGTTTAGTYTYSDMNTYYDLSNPIAKPVFPFSDDTVFKDIKYPKNYILTYVRSYSKDVHDLDYKPTAGHTSINMIASVNDDLFGITPEQLLAVVADFVKSLEPSEELTAAAKHVQYALGFLQKDSINKSKI